MARLTVPHRLCNRCGQSKPVAGGKMRAFGRGFVCAQCVAERQERHATKAIKSVAEGGSK